MIIHHIFLFVKREMQKVQISIAKPRQRTASLTNDEVRGIINTAEEKRDDIICIVAVVALDDEDNINDALISALTEWINDNPTADIHRISEYLFSCIPYSDEAASESA